jgi:hypothetical protein
MTLKQKTIKEKIKKQTKKFTRFIKDDSMIQKSLDLNVVGNNKIFKLYKYAVFIPWDGKLYVKDGEHKDTDIDGAKRYVANETVGKIRALIGEDMFLGIIDMSEHAIKLNRQYDPNLEDGNRKGSYDKEIVHNFTYLKKTKVVNIAGGKSLELYEVPENIDREELKYRWNEDHKKLLNGGVELPKKIYNARPFIEDFDKKLKTTMISRGLLGGCPGSGKEQGCNTILIRIQDIKKYDEKKINVFTATIPATLCEPLNELAEVQGMNINSVFVNNNRLKIYVIEKWYKKHRADLKPQTRLWCDKFATLINDSNEIPSTHPQGQVPVLFAGFHEIARTTTKELRKEYQSIVGRVGTLVIGEAHKFLNPKLKMWQVIKQLNPVFLMPVTGTPYELMFGESSSELYFGPGERSIMTRQEMMNMKKIDPTGPFKDMPPIFYYGIGGEINHIIEEMKKDSQWKSDADGMLLEKLIMTYDRTQIGTKKFKYWNQIFRLFSRIFSVPQFGSPDPMSLYALPKLCDKAKENVIVYLPQGTKDGGVAEVIPELVRLLEEAGGLGNHKGLTAYGENVDSLREEIDSPKPTAVFTCYAKATGTNIPAWGLSIVMRKIGNSLTFIEQAFDGRPSRAFAGKTNCGVVLTELYNIANLKIMAEEKLSSERNENKSHLDIITEHLDCNFYYSFKNGAFKSIERPEFQNELEKNISKNGYEVSLCFNKVKAPDSYKFINIEKENNQSVNVKIGENNNQTNKNAKNKIIKKIKNNEQLSFDLHNGAEFLDENWHQLKKKHLSILRRIGFSKNLKTLNEIQDFIDQAVCDNNLEILTMIPGYEYISLTSYLTNPHETDQTLAQRFLDKLNSSKDIDSQLDVMDQDDHAFNKSKGDVVMTQELANELVDKVSDDDWKTYSNILEPAVKKGRILNAIRKKCEKLGIDWKNKIYICDLDPLNIRIIKKIFDFPLNRCYNSIDDIMKQNIEFDFIGTNPPYQNNKEADKTAKRKTGNKLWYEFVFKAHKLLKNGGTLAMVTPNQWLSGGVQKRKGNWGILKDLFKNNQLVEAHVSGITKKYFPKVGIDIGWWIMKKQPVSAPSIFYIDSDEIMSIDLTRQQMLSPETNKESFSIVEKVLSNKKIPKVKSYYFNSHCEPGSQNESEEKTLINQYEHWIMGSSSDKSLITRWFPKNMNSKVNYKKILFTMSTRYWQPHLAEASINVASLGQAIEVPQNSTQQGFESVYYSKLFRYICFNLQIQQNGFMKTEWVKNLPSMDLSKIWSDDKIFDHFALSISERNYIEKVVF